MPSLRVRDVPQIRRDGAARAEEIEIEKGEGGGRRRPSAGNRERRGEKKENGLDQRELARGSLADVLIDAVPREDSLIVAGTPRLRATTPISENGMPSR
jgi:hypothetical protein